MKEKRLSLKIAHLVGPDIHGGAARGALWLHEALLDHHISSHLFVQYQTKEDQAHQNVTSIIKRKSVSDYLLKADRLLLKRYFKRDRTSLFSPGLYGGLLDKIDNLNEFDIIHLHWINGGFLTIKSFSMINKPIVWTIRDMWPFTGGCHYSLDCENYKSGCGACPQLGSQFDQDLSYQCFNFKQSSYGENIYPVAISPWLQKCMSESKLFHHKKVEMIFNGVKTSQFKKIDKTDARKKLGLPTDKVLIATGAINLMGDKRKGFSQFSQALSLLNPDFDVVLFGSDEVSKANFKQTIYNFGKINNEVLAQVYSAIDVFVAPSIQEAFGKTIVEAMSCGAPVVTFDNSGAANLISSGENGYTAKYLDHEDLADKIKQAVKLSETCSQNCRKYAEENFSLEHLSREYIALYKRILN